MRRLVLPVLILCVGLAASPGAPPALAQTEPAVALRLVSQSAWNGPERPLHLSFSATSRTDIVLENLSAVLSIMPPPRSRAAFAGSLRQDVSFPIFAYSFAQRGVLRPGQERSFDIEQALDLLTARAETAIYPLRVELRSNDASIGTLRTPMVFLAEAVPAQARLSLAWTFPLTGRLQLAPDGSFLPGPLESDIEPGGRLDRVADLLVGLARRGVPLDLAMSATLADQLLRMSDGYRIADPSGVPRDVARDQGGAADASGLLTKLRRVASTPSSEIMAGPAGEATIPSLIGGGLSGSVPILLGRGRTLVEEALGKVPRPDALRPPGSQLDEASLAALAGLGYHTVILDPGYVEADPASTFSPPATVRLTSADSSLIALTPDAGVAATLSAYPDDPRLAAQAALGELAAIWLEFPATPGRGAALLISDRAGSDIRLLDPFTSLVRRSPWLRPASATYLSAFLSDPPGRPLPTRRHPTFGFRYVESWREAQTSLGQFRRTVHDAEELVAEMQDHLQLALSGAFLRREAPGRAFISMVARTIESTYQRVAIDELLLTLASGSGDLPVTVRNDSGLPMTVRIRLLADRRISFVSGNVRMVELAPGTQTFTFPVRAATTGRFPIKIQVRTAVADVSASTITETQVIVRSRAYNRVALLMTAGAGLFLLGWWGRRFLSRKRT